MEPNALYGLIGSPVGHSLSPLLHNTAFRLLHIPAVFIPWELAADKLPAFMEAFRLLHIRGAAVTIPHKQNILPLLDEITDRARAVGAVNLIYRRPDPERICGDNTDVAGFMAPLADDSAAPVAKALLLGCGGVARAAAVGLQSLGCRDISVSGREPERLARFAEEFGLRAVPWEARGDFPADLIVNCTPLGMRGGYEDQSAYAAEWFSGRFGLACDLVYTPAEPRFLREARTAGWRVIGGLDMFLGQAEAQFLTWTGQRLPEGARQAVREALSRPDGQ